MSNTTDSSAKAWVGQFPLDFSRVAAYISQLTVTDLPGLPTIVLDDFSSEMATLRVTGLPAPYQGDINDSEFARRISHARRLVAEGDRLGSKVYHTKRIAGYPNEPLDMQISAYFTYLLYPKTDATTGKTEVVIQLILNNAEHATPAWVNLLRRKQQKLNERERAFATLLALTVIVEDLHKGFLIAQQNATLTGNSPDYYDDPVCPNKEDFRLPADFNTAQVFSHPTHGEYGYRDFTSTETIGLPYSAGATSLSS